MKDYKSMAKQDLIDIILSQEENISQLEYDLTTEREQIDILIEDILPIAQDIKDSNKFFKFVKIIKLAIVIVDRIIKFSKDKSKGE